MAKMIYTVAEMIAELNWTMEEVDAAIASSKRLDAIADFDAEAKRAFVEWDDYHDKMQVCRAAWDAFLATDRTGREAKAFSISEFSDAQRISYGPYLPASGSTISVPKGFFRSGDTIVVTDADTYIGRKGTPVAMKPKTIRIVEVYPETRDGSVKARFVVEEVLAELSERDRAFEEASSDERRKISQKAAAAETRKAAKALGGKALTGTPAQQKWAETIRKDALAVVPSEVADKLLSGKRFQSAKWWIDNRVDAKKSGWLAQQAA